MSFIYKVQKDAIFDGLRDILKKRGWIDHDPKNGNTYNLHWKTTRFTTAECTGDGDKSGRLMKVNH